MAIAGLADLAGHLELAGYTEPLHEHTASELSAHLIGFVGMVVVLLGIVLYTPRSRAFAKSFISPAYGLVQRSGPDRHLSTRAGGACQAR